MKIAFVVSTCLPLTTKKYSGLERAAFLLANEIGKKYDVTVFAAKGSEKGNFKLVETIKPSYNTFFLNRELLHIAIINNLLEEFDLIDFHIHSFPFVPKKYYEKSIFSSHGYLDCFPEECLNKVRIFARSKAHAEYLSKKYNTEIDFCYNPVDIDKYAIGKERKFYLFFSRICREKGVLNFIEIAKEFPEELFVIAGDDDIEKGADPILINHILKNKPENVLYLGGVDEQEKAVLLSEAKALISPYDKNYFEVFGIFLVEALASGTPCFVLNSGAVSEILEGTGLTDYGYVANDLEELKNALKDFVKGKIDFNAEKLRKRAERFKPDVIAEEYLKKLNL